MLQRVPIHLLQRQQLQQLRVHLHRVGSLADKQVAIPGRERLFTASYADIKSHSEASQVRNLEALLS